MKQVRVAVGVVLRDSKVLLAKRADHQHQGGLWEFPGGKIETGESVETALARELAEEVAIEIGTTEPLIVVEHDYGDKRVSLETLIVRDFKGEAAGLEGQPVSWVPLCELREYAFPEANKAILDTLLDKELPND